MPLTVLVYVHLMKLFKLKKTKREQYQVNEPCLECGKPAKEIKTSVPRCAPFIDENEKWWAIGTEVDARIIHIDGTECTVP